MEAPRPQVEQTQSESPGFNRPRAMTESSYASESTATPPKLLEGGLDFDDGFGSMFETFGKRQSQILEQPPTLGGANTESPVGSTTRYYKVSTNNDRKIHRQPDLGCLQSPTLVTDK